MADPFPADKGNIRTSRDRTHLFRDVEYTVLEWLCPRMPKWVMPDMLTAFGFAGSLIICWGLWLATYIKICLLVSVSGLAIQWFGDSLDGRLAYYRKTPRKWYGWALDINTDWVSACIVGVGFYIYLPTHKIVAFVFVVAYGGSMIVSLLRYKITDKYTIDTLLLGPTELRVIIAIVLIVEIFRPDTLLQFGFLGSLLLIAMNLTESFKLLKMADERDRKERSRTADFE